MSRFAGTGRLIRLALRRDRITLTAWVAGIAGLAALFAAMSVESLPTYEDVVSETRSMSASPGLRMLGLASGPTVGGYAILRGHLTLAILAAIMSSLAVVRHTRQDEETGRAELLASAMVGRHARLAAAIVVGVVANVLLALLSAAALIANGLPSAGSLLGGIYLGAVGLAFVAVAAVTTQLSASARTANGLAAAVLGVCFGLSALGNMLGRVDATGMRVTPAWPALLSPIGWAQQLRPYGGDYIWPLGLFAAFFAAGLAVAGRIGTRRDFGRGVLPGRTGRASARPGLLRPYGLVGRLQRGQFIGWAAGLGGFGFLLGSSSGQLTTVQGAAADWYARMGGTEVMVDAFRAAMVAMAGMGTAVYVVQALLRLRAEEAAGRAEPVLAVAVGRPAWAATYVVTALAGAVGLLLLFAAAMGGTAAATLGREQLWSTVVDCLLQLPAVMVIGGVVIALSGLAPRWVTPVSWLVLAASILTGPIFGTSLGLPQGVSDLSPFTHLRRLPAEAVPAGAIVALVAIAVALAGTGLAALRRRDLVLPT